MYVYSLNSEIELNVYAPLVDGNEGAAIRLNNTGREGAVYLTHILNNWDNLAGKTATNLMHDLLCSIQPSTETLVDIPDHTLFSQAVADPIMNNRVEVHLTQLLTPKWCLQSSLLFA